MLENISEEKFEAHKTALATLILEKPKKMKEVMSKYWSEISSRLYNFDRDNMEVEQLYSLKKTDVLDFYQVFDFLINLLGCMPDKTELIWSWNIIIIYE